MWFEYILLEILLGAMLLGFIGAYRKRLFDRVALFLTIPVAFAGAIYVARNIINDSTVDKISDLIGLNGIEGVSDTFGNTVLTVAEAAAAPIIATLVFWILLLLLRIVAGIVLSIIHLITGAHRRDKEARRNKRKRPLWSRLGAGIVGALSGFVIVMLSMIPLMYINNMIEPAVEIALEDENDGTYANELAGALKENAMPLAEGTVFSKIQTITGMRKLTNSALDTLTDVEIKSDDGKSIRFNFTDFVALFAKEGVDASIVYENSCKSTGTAKDLSPVSSMLLRLAESDEFMNAAAALYSDIKLAFPDMSIPYDIDSADTLRSDITAAAELVKIISSDLASVSMDTEDLLPAILEYLESEESSKKVVNAVATSNLYKTKFPVLMEYALKLLCEQIDISENKSADYEKFIASLTDALNDKSIGAYDKDGAEFFIKYCAENGIKPSDYAIADESNKTETDKAYIAYVDFITRKNKVEAVFVNYRIDDGKKATYFVSSTAQVYVFDKSAGIWSLHDGKTELRDSSYAAQLLSDEINAMMSSDPELAVTGDIIKGIIPALSDFITKTDISVAEGTSKILSAVYSEDGYEPTDSVFKEDIINSLNKDFEHDKKHNDSFATALSIMAQVYGDLTAESDEASTDTVIDSFDDIGRLLDCMKSMESTKDVPDKMLLAITRNESFSDVFSTNAANEALENLRTGASTYEEFFTTIQGIYGIINEIIPSET